MRVLAGLVRRADATKAIETSWRERQRRRIAAPPWFLYHDRTSDPDTLNVKLWAEGICWR